jgi:hypothetical protein
MDTSARWHRHYRRIRAALPVWHVPVAYLLLSFLFHAIDVDILHVSLAPGDGAVHGVPSKIHDAEPSLWNPYILSGVSRLATQGFQSLYWPGILIMKLFPSGFGYNLNLLLHYALAGYFMYLFVGRLGLRPWSAFISGICFMFCGFMSSHKGHHMMMNAATWLPLVLYCAERFLSDRKQPGWLLGSAAALAMSFYADYLAVPMYIAMVTVPYVCFRSIQTSTRGWLVGARNALLTAATILGLGMMLAAPYILPILESVPRVTREQINYAFFSSYSFPALALPMLLFPFAFGTQSPGFYRASYFGPWNLTELAGYMGVVPVAFAILAFLVGRKQNRQIWFWSAVVAVGFLLVLGENTPLHHLLYGVPAYNMFRAPARNWLEVHFAMAVLAGFGVDLIGREAIAQSRLRCLLRRVWSGIAIATVAIGMAFYGIRILAPYLDVRKARGLLPWDFGSGFSVADSIALARDCWSFGSPNIYMPFVVVFLGGLGTWVAVFWLKSDARRWGLIAFLMVADLFTFGHFHDAKYVKSLDLSRPGSNAVYQWLREHDPELSRYRILPFETMESDELFPNVNIPYHVRTVNGYGSILLKEYSRLLGLDASGTVGRARELIENNGMLSMLGTRYLVTKDPGLKAVIERAACKGWPLGEAPCNPLAESSAGAQPTYQKVLEAARGIAVYRNNKVLPRLRFAKGVRCVADFAAAEAIMRNGAQFNPAETTIVECGSGLTSPAMLQGGIVLGGDLETPDSWMGTVSTEGAALLVRSESSYPGWVASVDGKSAPVLNVDGILQGIVIDAAGKHRVELVFRPRSFRLGLILMFAGLLGTCFLLGVGRCRARIWKLSA